MEKNTCNKFIVKLSSLLPLLLLMVNLNRREGMEKRQVKYTSNLLHSELLYIEAQCLLFLLRTEVEKSLC